MTTIHDIIKLVNDGKLDEARDLFNAGVKFVHSPAKPAKGVDVKAIVARADEIHRDRCGLRLHGMIGEFMAQAINELLPTLTTEGRLMRLLEKGYWLDFSDEPERIYFQKRIDGYWHQVSGPHLDLPSALSAAEAHAGITSKETAGG